LLDELLVFPATAPGTFLRHSNTPGRSRVTLPLSKKNATPNGILTCNTYFNSLGVKKGQKYAQGLEFRFRGIPISPSTALIRGLAGRNLEPKIPVLGCSGIDRSHLEYGLIGMGGIGYNAPEIFFRQALDIGRRRRQ
jgi:hypothetical protein